MYRIIYMGSYNEAICNILCRMSQITVVGYIADPSLNTWGAYRLADYWESKNIKKVDFNEENIKMVDLILVNGYSRIIMSEMLSKYIFVNIHAGNLPMWRGTSANSWAILNGDNKIAYTLHRVTDMLDAGPIYHKYEYELLPEEKYGDGRKKLEKLMENSLENVLFSIIEGTNTGYQQMGKYVYCNPFRKKDGYILNWNMNSSDFLNKFRVLGAPYGTGVHLQYKGAWYEILDMKIDENFAVSNTIPGAVVYKNSDYVWIKTKDTAIKVSQLRKDEQQVITASDLLYIGARLSLDTF